MNDLVAPRIFLAYGGIEFLNLKARSGRVGVAMDHADNIGPVALALFRINVKLNRVTRAQRITITITCNSQHHSSPSKLVARLSRSENVKRLIEAIRS